LNQQFAIPEAVGLPCVGIHGSYGVGYARKVNVRELLRQVSALQDA